MNIAVFEFEMSNNRFIGTINTGTLNIIFEPVKLDTDLEKFLGIIIIHNKESNLSEIISFLFKNKECNNLKVWMQSEKLIKSDRDIFIKLGVCGFYDQSYEVEEIASILENNLMDTDIKLKNKICNMKIGDWIEKNLTKREGKFFKYLLENSEKICTYENIQKYVYDNKKDLVNSKQISANIIYRIREKLINNNYDNILKIKTINGKGYILERDEKE